MQNTLNKFFEETVKIRKHIDFLIWLRDQTIDQTYISSIDNKVMEYKSLIIALYGLFEETVKSLIELYIRALCSNVSYTSLNETIKAKNIEFSAQLILSISTKPDQYSTLNKAEIIGNLHTCTSEVKCYKLNHEGFLMNSGNLKHKRICTIFDYLGITKFDEVLSKHIYFRGIHSSNKFNQIDDLVERRNSIAHSLIQSDDILDFSIIIPLIEFLEQYTTGVFETLQESFDTQIIKIDELASITYDIYNSEEYSNIIGIKGISEPPLDLFYIESDIIKRIFIDSHETHTEGITLKLKHPILNSLPIYINKTV